MEDLGAELVAHVFLGDGDATETGGKTHKNWEAAKNRDSTPKFESLSRTHGGYQVSKLRIQ